MKHVQKETQLKGRQIVGKVVSLGTPKTVVVAVDHFVKHPLYIKATRRTHRFAAHNESFELTLGDQVRIVESAPISKTKRFTVIAKL